MGESRKHCRCCRRASSKRSNLSREKSSSMKRSKLTRKQSDCYRENCLDSSMSILNWGRARWISFEDELRERHTMRAPPGTPVASMTVAQIRTYRMENQVNRYNAWKNVDEAYQHLTSEAQEELYRLAEEHYDQN